MRLDTLTLISFSPTGTTRKVLQGIASGMGAPTVQNLDLTRVDRREAPFHSIQNGTALIGAPVYAGRIPPAAAQRFRRIDGGGSPAVLVVTYGNRAYEDALLELLHLSVEVGFRPVAGAAFVGEHSYSTSERPIAPGRPDTEDLRKAEAFGRAVRGKLEALHRVGPDDAPGIPGSLPYREPVPKGPGSAATRADLCTLCGTCATACPTAAVSVGEEVATDSDLCIFCCACIKNCPTGARYMDHPKIQGVADWLYENCRERKEPEWFL